MKTHRHLLSTFALVATIGLAGCGGAGDSDDNLAAAPAPPVGAPPPGPPPGPPPAAAAPAVPDGAGLSVAAFVSFILGLSTGDESSEPLTLKDTFAVPADDTSEPTPLT